MSEPNLILLRQTLAEAAKDDAAQPPHARAFAAWIQRDRGKLPELLDTLAREAAAADGPARQSVLVAVLGYAVSFSKDLVPAFLDAAAWLQARQHFVPGRPLSFEIDGLGLFGLTIGVLSIDANQAAAARTWLEDLLRRSLQSSRPDDWNESLIKAAYELLSAQSGGYVASDLRSALCSKGLMQTTAAERADAWSVISGLAAVDGMTRAAAQAASLTFLLRDTAIVRPGSATVDDAARLLSGVARSMRRWPWEDMPRTSKSAIARWEIENEYHVQDMLWAILAPVFPDLDDEEWLKSLGQHHPRADLAIPSLALIVEVKFLRRSTPATLSEMVQEVAADASTYLAEDSPFQQVVAFIWDDSATTEQHAELRQGLMRIRGVKDAVILPRPRKMVRAILGS